MPIKVLAVDDEDDVRRLIQVKLKKAGFEVITAVNGEEGVEKCKAEAPDVVIMDWMMPKMDGPPPQQRLRPNATRRPSCSCSRPKGRRVT